MGMCFQPTKLLIFPLNLRIVYIKECNKLQKGKTIKCVLQKTYYFCIIITTENWCYAIAEHPIKNTRLYDL